MGQQRVIIWGFVLVGGRYDGAKGLRWRDHGEGVPDTILVGVCPGDALCTGSEQVCRTLGHGNAHTAYWLPEEDETDRPEQTSTYELEHSYVERGTDGFFHGTARYVVRGIGLPKAESVEETVEHWRRSSEPVCA